MTILHDESLVTLIDKSYCFLRSWHTRPFGYSLTGCVFHLLVCESFLCLEFPPIFPSIYMSSHLGPAYFHSAITLKELLFTQPEEWLNGFIMYFSILFIHLSQDLSFIIAFTYNHYILPHIFWEQHIPSQQCTHNSHCTQNSQNRVVV